MKTLIELYDKETICNSVAVLSLQFDKVVFLCDNSDKDGKVLALVSYFQRRNADMKVEIQYSDTLDYAALCTMLDQFDNQDPYFEMNGGQGALLIAVTRYCLQHDSRSFFINLPEKKFVNINRCQDLAAAFAFPHYSIQEAIMSAGAIFSGNNHAPIDIKDSLLTKQINNIFFVVKTDFEAWIHLTGLFSNALARRSDAAGNSLTLRMDSATRNKLSDADEIMLAKLSRLQVISITRNDGETVYGFASSFVLSLFRTTGNILEYAVFVALYQAHLFTDVKMSVIIDYDFQETGSVKSCCEIDVIVIKDVTPVFISCKIGAVHESDLYEIKLNTLRIGGHYATSALVTANEMRRSNPILYQKAKELGILIVDRSDLVKNRLTGKISNLVQSGLQPDEDSAK